ncbi:DUF438 domain-containing protein [Roseimarinus sediminis]|jgi:hypothetical protein|uniref:DUF438 domain-containing protein n=1 Tax=Roseimarinus sediminis TaxID=1610899 RepID=UPI003D2087A5
MSELINNSEYRKSKLKELILKLHAGYAPGEVKAELRETLSQIPYGEVVEVEQELIAEGLPEEDVLQLCDIHGEVLDGSIDQSGSQDIPQGHPLDVFIQENKALNEVIDKTYGLLNTLHQLDDADFTHRLYALQGCFNELMDVDKHYQRKEYLVFPYLEQREITGPPKVMWGKHDEIRDHLKGCIELLREPGLKKDDLLDAFDLLFLPVLKELREMVKKEEDILFPMAMDTLTIEEWWNIHQQTIEIGFTLYDPQVEWKPEGIDLSGDNENIVSGGLNAGGNLQLPSGSFTPQEIKAILNTVPVDMTFVDKNDKVKYFTQGSERIFTRSRSIINRDVRLCHPPGSVHIVEKIIDDFKSGKEQKASFWIQMKGKFILIEYYALRDDNGEYLGTLEVSQDLTNARSLEGERRILSYDK